jgi:cell division protein FtsW
VLSFLDPWENVRDGGYQLVQSFLAFRNGGMFGLGLGESKQKLFFLPKSHTDFIFSIIGEELGVSGSFFIATCFAIVTYLGLQIAFKQRIKRRFFLALGISLLVSIQAIFNLSVTLGLVPTKGISLPFVSAGTSSLLVFLTLIGILISLDREAEIDQSIYKHSTEPKRARPI